MCKTSAAKNISDGLGLCLKVSGRLKSMVDKLAGNFHQTLFLTFPIGFFQALAFVVLFFTFGQADFHFDAAAVVMQIKRHNGVTRAFGFTDELVNLGLIEQ